MYDLDAAGSQKLGHRYQVLVGGNQYGDVIVVRPGETDHVRCHTNVNTLLLRAPHGRPASGTGGYLPMASRAAWWRPPLLPRNHRDTHTGKGVHYRRCPPMQIPIPFPVRVEGSVEVQPLILLRCVQEIDEYPYTVASTMCGLIGVQVAIQNKKRDAGRRPWSIPDRTPVFPLWAAIRWVVMSMESTPEHPDGQRPPRSHRKRRAHLLAGSFVST